MTKLRCLHVAAAQVHSGGSVAENLQRITRQTAAAATVGADLVLFAEGALQGYDYDMTEPLLRAIAVTSDAEPCSRLVALAQTHRIAVLCGFIELAEGSLYNSVLVARPDGSRTVQRKHVLNKIEQNAGLTSGPAERTPFVFNDVRCAIVICADGAIPNLDQMLEDGDFDYRLAPTGGGGKMSEMLHESQLLTSQGREQYETNRPRVFKPEAILTDCHRTGFTSSNALGPVGERTCHQGHCMIVDRLGVMRAQVPGTIVLEHQQDQMIHAELTFPGGTA